MQHGQPWAEARNIAACLKAWEGITDPTAIVRAVRMIAEHEPDLCGSIGAQECMEWMQNIAKAALAIETTNK